jgi:predicted negative regulator of RcsB-dependent stress response
MAFEDYDEYEQGEQVRKWIKENGIAVAVGVVLALGLIFGYRQWKVHTANHQMQAAASYADLQTALSNDNPSATSGALGNLRKDFGDTPYAAFGAAAVAQYDAGKGKLKDAGENLQWAVDHSGDPALRALFTVRLARVDLALGEPHKALALLGGAANGDYPALVNELRGDALLKLGRSDAARSAYEAALAALDKNTPERQVLKMKLDDLTQPKVAQPGKQGT